METSIISSSIASMVLSFFGQLKGATSNKVFHLVTGVVRLHGKLVCVW